AAGARPEGERARNPYPRLEVMDSGPATARSPAPANPRRRRWRRRGWSEIALPDRAAVEMNGHAVGRIDRALGPGVDPDPACRREPVGPGAHGLAGLVEQIEVGSVLGDEGGRARRAGPAGFDAAVGAGEIDRLRRCFAGGEHVQDANGG